MHTKVHHLFNHFFHIYSRKTDWRFRYGLNRNAKECKMKKRKHMEQSKAKQSSSLATLLMVSLIFPGIGQFCNRQPIKAVILMVTFGICFGIVMVRGLTWYIAYISTALHGEFVKPPLEVMISFGAMSVVIYLYSVIDSIVTSNRKNKKDTNKNHED